DRLAALGEMAAGLAHEIRNPLGAIKGAAQYLDPAQLQGGDGEILQIIVEEVNRLDGVVAQFLDYSRPFPNATSGKFQSTDLNDVRVADTGAGIAEDALDRIFIPFYTTKTKGTGLGLAISQRIVKGHGGTIEVQSRVGEGTEFILRFPSATALDTAGRLGMVQTAPALESATQTGS